MFQLYAICLKSFGDFWSKSLLLRDPECNSSQMIGLKLTNDSVQFML